MRKQRRKDGEQLQPAIVVNFDVLTGSHCWRETAQVLMMTVMIMMNDMDDAEVPTAFHYREICNVLVATVGHPAGHRPACLCVLEQCCSGADRLL